MKKLSQIIANTSAAIRNVMMTRTNWIRSYMDPRRDIEKECGHPYVVGIEDYRKLFKRGDVAARVVNLYPEESWAEDPVVFETEDPEETAFEKAWKDLDKKFGIFSLLERADVLSGVGRFGIILIGIDDGLTLDKQVAAINDQGEPSGTTAEHKLLYLRTFDESLVRVATIEGNLNNPRYGLPTLYEIKFNSEDELGLGTAVVTNTKVHWTRIVHLADNRTTSDVFGSPRMEIVFNRLLDLSKIAGGSGEMFWKGGFPGLSLETMQASPDEEITLDLDATKEQVEAYMNGLQRYLALENMKANSLNVEVADPTPHIQAQINLISVAMACPHRIFMGAEIGQLASGQDVIAWNKRMNRRREKYLSPHVLRPFATRLIDFGVLPPVGEEGVQVSWSDLNAPSDQDAADIATKQTTAMSKYVAAGVDSLIAPFHYLTLVCGFTDEEANSIINDQGEFLKRVVLPAPPGTPKPGSNPASRNGNARVATTRSQ